MKLIVSYAAAFLLFSSCGSKSSDDPVAAAPTYAQVATAIAASCMGSTCHSSGLNMGTCGNFTTSETTFKDAQACATTANTPAARVALTSGLMMPPANSTTGALSAEGKAAIIAIK